MILKQSVPFEVKHLDAEKDGISGKIGTFKGYASTFGNIDRDNDVIDNGAFGSFENPNAVKLLWQHDHGSPIGIWSKLKEDKHGLWAEGELNLEVQRGREAYSLMKQGALGDMSIGFRVPKGQTYDKEVADGASKKRVRHIKQVNLMEVSIVSIPANPMARVSSVKSADGSMMSVRDFEGFLRDAGGLSLREAKIVISKGYHSLVGSVEEDKERIDDVVREADKSQELKQMAEFIKSMAAEFSLTSGDNA